MSTERVVAGTHLLINTPAEIRRLGQRTGTRDRAEVGVPKLEQHRPADQASTPQPHRNLVGQPEEFAAQEAGIRDVHLEGDLVADALLIVVRCDDTWIDPPRQLVQFPTRRVADGLLEECQRSTRDIADRTQAATEQGPLGCRADSPESADRQRMQESKRFIGRHDQQAIRFGSTGCELGDELGRGGTDGAGQPRLILHASANTLPDLSRRTEDAARPGDIQEGLIDAQPFDQRGHVVEDRHDLSRQHPILLEMRFEHDRTRAQTHGPRQRHCRAHAILAGRVVRGGHHRARRPPGDDDGLRHQLRPVEQLHRREERVEVDVQDRGRAAVDGYRADLPPAAVLPAHASPNRASRLRAAVSLLDAPCRTNPMLHSAIRVAVMAGHHGRFSLSSLR